MSRCPCRLVKISPPQRLTPECQSAVSHLAGGGLGDLLVEADVQVVARLVGEEEADGDLVSGGRQADVDLQLGLQDTQLPQPAAVAHHHGAHRLLDLQEEEEEEAVVRVKRSQRGTVCTE